MHASLTKATMHDSEVAVLAMSADEPPARAAIDAFNTLMSESHRLIRSCRLARNSHTVLGLNNQGLCRSPFPSLSKPEDLRPHRFD
jgi:hypothetical protein